MATLDQAILMATRAHQGQKDKAGAPYILHPLRVMLRMDSDVLRMAAVLHDVVEDTRVSIEELRCAGFAPEVLELVDCLTRRAGEPYERFIERIRNHPEARRIKLADLEDNMDLTRVRQFTARDGERLQKYHKAWRALTGGLGS